MGGFFVDLALAAASVGVTIQLRISSADSLVPTPSSGLALLPFPAMAWQTEHFCAVYTSSPFFAASCAVAMPAEETRAKITSQPFVTSVLCMQILHVPSPATMRATTRRNECRTRT